MDGKYLLLANLLLAGYLTGLIWTIQVVHYPSFAKFSSSDFLDFHHFHTARITLIVALPMVIELGLAFALWWTAPAWMPAWVNLLQLILVLVVWVNTFFMAVPLHNQLEAGFDLHLIQKLVNVNWIRTLAWSGRLGLLGFYLARLI